MSDNLYSCKEVKETIFNRKTKIFIILHPPLVFNNSYVSQATSQKYLVIVLDIHLTSKENLKGVVKN